MNERWESPSPAGLGSYDEYYCYGTTGLHGHLPDHRAAVPAAAWRGLASWPPSEFPTCQPAAVTSELSDPCTPASPALHLRSRLCAWEYGPVRHASINPGIDPSASLARLAPRQWSARTPRRPWPAGPEPDDKTWECTVCMLWRAGRAPIPPRPRRPGNYWRESGEDRWGEHYATAATARRWVRETRMRPRGSRQPNSGRLTDLAGPPAGRQVLRSDDDDDGSGHQWWTRYGRQPDASIRLCLIGPSFWVLTCQCHCLVTNIERYSRPIATVMMAGGRAAS